MRFLWLAFGVCLAAFSPMQAESCRPSLVAELPIARAQGGHLVVPARIGDHALRFLVDTGSPFSVLSPEAASAIGLSVEKYPRPVLRLFYGGGLMRTYARTDALSFAGADASPAEFMIAPAGKLHDDVDGLIGLDILLAYDTDFDFAANRLTLYRPHACAGRTGRWADAASVVRIPFAPQETHIRLNVDIDGASFPAVLDTGIPNARVSLDAAERRLGLTPNSAGMVAFGGNGRPVFYQYPFKTLTLAGVTIRDPGISIDTFSRSKTNSFEVLLGLGVLRRFRLFIAGAEHALYFSPAEPSR